MPIVFHKRLRLTLEHLLYQVSAMLSAIAKDEEWCIEIKHSKRGK
jgi:hypothetical protein